jgi:hypothetical protein
MRFKNCDENDEKSRASHLEKVKIHRIAQLDHGDWMNRRQFFLGWLYAVTMIPLGFFAYGLLAYNETRNQTIQGKLGYFLINAQIGKTEAYINASDLLVMRIEGIILLGLVLIYLFLIIEPIIKNTTILDRQK